MKTGQKTHGRRAMGWRDGRSDGEGKRRGGDPLPIYCFHDGPRKSQKGEIYLSMVKSVYLCYFHYDKPHTHTHTCIKIKRVVFRREATSFQYSHPYNVSLFSLGFTRTQFPVRFTNNSVTFFDLIPLTDQNPEMHSLFFFFCVSQL